MSIVDGRPARARARWSHWWSERASDVGSSNPLPAMSSHSDDHHDAWVVYVHMPSSGGRLPACSPVAATWKCAVRGSRCMGSFPANQLFYALGRSTAYYNVATTWRSVTSNGCGEQRVRPGGRAMICVQPVCRARAVRREGDDATVIPCSAVAHAYCAATMCLLILFPRARAHQRQWRSAPDSNATTRSIWLTCTVCASLPGRLCAN